MWEATLEFEESTLDANIVDCRINLSTEIRINKCISSDWKGVIKRFLDGSVDSNLRAIHFTHCSIQDDVPNMLNQLQSLRTLSMGSLRLTQWGANWDTLNGWVPLVCLRSLI